ncbi:hypothetical protein SAMN04487894_107201 [Niabella drilacis]|uniref:Uncharacterized protein n=1 Tax=Niabella drilacis (strain DSM 25811 / CCM 8410 / CCUG 62505 / LMG 26954 / E90) TaxID=1285928 RepID=A0A1G6THM4_NIADE|nr:hypothetical protein SAMN04487894_107201 [Niabella drilacis]
MLIFYYLDDLAEACCFSVFINLRNVYKNSIPLSVNGIVEMLFTGA